MLAPAGGQNAGTCPNPLRPATVDRGSAMVVGRLQASDTRCQQGKNPKNIIEF